MGIPEGRQTKKQNPTFSDTPSRAVKYPLPSLCITRTCPNQRKLVENFHVRTTQAAPTGPDQGRSKHRRPQQAEEAQGRGQAQTQSQAQSQDAYPSQPPGPGEVRATKKCSKRTRSQRRWDTSGVQTLAFSTIEPHKPL